MEVKVFDIIPTEISKDPQEFLSFLGGPAIINAGPDTEENVIVSCLMHGNEPSGYFAVHKILQKISKQHNLKKKVQFVFMNVRAALEGETFSHRFCDDESDMNRIWGVPGTNSDQNNVVKFMMNFIEKSKPELLVDLHNTTGSNPVFAITNSFEKETLEAAAVASNIIWLHSSKSTLSKWATNICPSITIECGKNIDPRSDDNAVTVLRNLLIHFGALEGTTEPNENIRLLYEAEPIEVKTHDIYVADENSGHDIVLMNNIEGFNTVELNNRGTDPKILFANLEKLLSIPSKKNSAESSNLIFELDIPKNLPDIVFIDDSRMLRAFYFLIKTLTLNITDGKVSITGRIRKMVLILYIRLHAQAIPDTKQKKIEKLIQREEGLLFIPSKEDPIELCLANLELECLHSAIKLINNSSKLIEIEISTPFPYGIEYLNQYYDPKINSKSN